MSSLSCWCSLHVYPSLTIPPFFPFPLLLLLPLLPFLSPLYQEQYKFYYQAITGTSQFFWPLCRRHPGLQTHQEPSGWGGSAKWCQHYCQLDWIHQTLAQFRINKAQVLSRRLHTVQPQIIVAGCHVAQATSLKYLGVTVSSNLSWSANIHQGQGQETAGPALSTFSLFCPCLITVPMCGTPTTLPISTSSRLYSKVSHGPLVLRLSGPHPNYELASSCLLHAEKGKSCCCATIFCAVVVQSYHPQYSLLTPTLLPRFISVWHCIVLSQKHLPIFTPSSQVLSHAVEQAVIWPHLCSLTSYVKASFKSGGFKIISTLSTIPASCTLNSGVITFLVLPLILHLSSPFACSLLSLLL